MSLPEASIRVLALARPALLLVSVALLAQGGCLVGDPCAEGGSCDAAARSDRADWADAAHCQAGASWEIVPLSATFALDERDRLAVEDLADPFDIEIEDDTELGLARGKQVREMERGWKVAFEPGMQHWWIDLGESEHWPSARGSVFARAWDSDGEGEDTEVVPVSEEPELEGDDFLAGFEIVLSCDAGSLSAWDDNAYLIGDYGDGEWHQLSARAHAKAGTELRIALRYRP